MTATVIDLVQDQLVKPLTKGLGKGWVVFPNTDAPDVIVKPTVIVKLQSGRRLPEAPLGAYQNTVSLYVVAPDGSTESQLTEYLFDVLEILDEQAQVNWSEYTRAVLGSNQCFEINLTSITLRKMN